MRYDFWNNPLIVTALRQKYRRGSPGALSTLYLLALVGLGAMFRRYWDDPQISWIRVYLVTVLAIQFLVSGAFSLVATSAALFAEVQQRTLDFQRIAALLPRQILAGKLLGEPAGGYLLAISTVPLTLWCALAGGCEPGVLALLYVQVATLGLMFGSMGLVQPLEPAVTKSGIGRQAGNAGLGPVVGFMVLASMPSAIGALAGGGALPPLLGLTLGTLTPVVSLIGLYRGTPWLPCVRWFSVDLPCLLVAPCAQALVAWFFFAGMTRKLLSPLLPLVSKPVAYAAIVIFDVLVAGSLYDRRPGAQPLEEVTAVFLGAHLAASLVLLYGSTPAKPCLLSWLWRFRRQQSALRAQLGGDRSANSLEALVLALSGGAIWLPAVWWPAYLVGSAPPLAGIDATTLHLIVGSALLLVALATAYQWFVLVAARSGTAAFALAAIAVIVLPALVGGYYEIRWLSSLTPVGQVIARLTTDDPLPSAPFYVIYGAIWLGSGWQVRRLLAAHAAAIDRRLAEMGVAPDAALAPQPAAPTAG